MRHGVVAVIGHLERFLVIQRAAEVEAPGYWTPLSGRIEPGESQAEAVARETMEEVGLRVTPVAKVWECPAESIDDFLLHWWNVRLDSDPAELSPDPREVGDTRWVTPQEFLALVPTFADDRKFFTSVLPTLDIRAR